MSDIVQVIARAIEEHEGMVKACELWRPPTEHCPSCQQRAKDAAQLRALRDRIVVIDELATRVVEMEAEVARLREALKRYGYHLSECLELWPDKVESCTCGLTAALAPKEASDAK